MTEEYWPFRIILSVRRREVYGGWLVGVGGLKQRATEPISLALVEVEWWIT